MYVLLNNMWKECKEANIQINRKNIILEYAKKIGFLVGPYLPYTKLVSKLLLKN